MARLALLTLALVLACAADDEPDKSIFASSTVALTTAGDEGDESSSDDGSSSAGDESSTGDPDACPEWCSDGCPAWNPLPWNGRKDLCICMDGDDCTDDGVVLNLQCVGYDPGIEPGHTRKLGRCLPI